MQMTMIEALNSALALELERDRRVVVFGEDIGANGGVFRVTEHLQNKFGEERVFDTPLAESGIIGTSIGMAIYGLRPIAEIQFAGFHQITKFPHIHEAPNRDILTLRLKLIGIRFDGHNSRANPPVLESRW